MRKFQMNDDPQTQNSYAYIPKTSKLDGKQVW